MSTSPFTQSVIGAARLGILLATGYIRSVRKKVATSVSHERLALDRHDKIRHGQSMAPPLLQLSNISLTLGGKPLLDSAEFIVAPGEKIGLVGRNGSGKSTLLKIAAGAVEPDKGEIFVQNGASLRYLAQEPDFSGFENVRAYVEAGLGPLDDPYRALYLLQSLGLTGDEQPATLSGGQARRAALARTLVAKPDLLLLDEPTNHLDLPAIEWLESELKNTRAALVLVSHDRRFLENLTGATVWLDQGFTRRLSRGFGEFEAWRDKIFEEEETARQKLDRKIEAEEHWMRYGVTGRRKRNMRRVGELEQLRARKREWTRRGEDVKLAVNEAETSGRLVVEAKNICKKWDDAVIVRDFSLRLLRGERLGLIGANGAGKTTLLNLLTAQIAPDSGSVRLGANVQMATLDQKRAALDPQTTLQAFLTGKGGDHVEINGVKKHVSSYAQDFLFRPEQLRTPLAKLSGGERARLMLARALALPSNFLVLDEPTNDLDLETLDLVEDLVASYAGAVLLVSHDRDFLDRTATSVIMAEGDGRWIEYAGGYSDMVAQRGSGVATIDPPPSRAEKPGRVIADRAQPKRKLSYKEARALEMLPAEIEVLRAKIAAAQKLLSDETLYVTNRQKFMEATNANAKATQALLEAEERWLELELLREELSAP